MDIHVAPNMRKRPSILYVYCRKRETPQTLPQMQFGESEQGSPALEDLLEEFQDDPESQKEAVRDQQQQQEEEEREQEEQVASVLLGGLSSAVHQAKVVEKAPEPEEEEVVKDEPQQPEPQQPEPQQPEPQQAKPHRAPRRRRKPTHVGTGRRCTGVSEVFDLMKMLEGDLDEDVQKEKAKPPKKKQEKQRRFRTTDRKETMELMESLDRELEGLDLMEPEREVTERDFHSLPESSMVDGSMMMTNQRFSTSTIDTLPVLRSQAAKGDDFATEYLSEEDDRTDDMEEEEEEEEKEEEEKEEAKRPVSLRSRAVSTVWDEETSENANNWRVRPNGRLLAASLNRLIIHLTIPSSPNLRFANMFLLTYHSFTSPQQLLAKLIERFTVPKGQRRTKKFDQSVRLPVQLRVINVLDSWLKTFPEDFTRDMLKQLDSFISNDLPREGHTAPCRKLGRHVPVIQTMLDGTPGRMALLQRMPSFSSLPPKPLVQINDDITDFFEVSSVEVARQMTLMDWSSHAQIRAVDLLDLAWTKKENRAHSQVLRCIGVFNQLSGWVSQSILDMPTVAGRVKRWSFWLKVAQHASKLQNFTAVVLIISGLNNSAVCRLKQTKAALGFNMKRTQSKLEYITTSNNTYRTYRALLDQLEPPMIPYLGLVLTDLTFIEQGNPNMTEDGLINWRKRELCGKVIMSFREKLLAKYNLVPMPNVMAVLEADRPLPQPEELYQLSLQREPRA